MKSSEIRRLFFDFFNKRGHTLVPSSSLIPAQDPTILFANAGMNQFKDVFLGKEKRSYARAVSIQKCVRAGGKHNDLDNVGFTKRHLTFFEMMGNFSFGDYFKKEAIVWAWEFVTQSMNLPKEKLHTSVYETDDESFEIWNKQVGIPKEKIHRLGKKDNFWQMGDVGPCGPCTEIFIDRGPEHGCAEPCGPACDCDRFLEIWNLVFMQFDQQANGELKHLKHTGVDTGMGLERLATIMQNVDSVYETDLFMPIIKKTEALTGVHYDSSAEIKAAFRVLADHIRSSTMIIADGGAPSNEGRGYVLRKIIRRGALFARKLTKENIFPELAKVVIKEFEAIYPELKENEALIVQILTSEIEKFSINLDRGQLILEQYFQENAQSKKISGSQAFKLYDTYGFPVELVHARAREKGYTVDMKGFETEMEKQQAQSGKKMADLLDHIDLPEAVQTAFTGYHELETHSRINALIKDGTSVQRISKGDTVYVLSEKAPFFIVGGGQVPDQGWLQFGTIKTPISHVRYINGRIAAEIKAPIDLKIGDAVVSIVDKTWRTNAMKNHTATHLLQAALIELFGKQIKQSGSLVHPDYLRFDFTYHQNVSSDDIKKVEDLVNAKIRENIPVSIEYKTYKEAIEQGVLAFFGEKYNPEDVRIVNVPGFSMELCGGTHVNRTGDIGAFKITDVSSISAGHRRIVALTGPKAIDLFQDTFSTTKNLSLHFNVPREQILEMVEKQSVELKNALKEIKSLKQQQLHAHISEWEKEITNIGSLAFGFIKLNHAEHDDMRTIAQILQSKRPGFYMLISDTGNSRTSFLATLHASCTTALNLKNFGEWAKDSLGLRGGGKDGSLQGGGGKFDVSWKDAITQWLRSNI